MGDIINIGSYLNEMEAQIAIGLLAENNIKAEIVKDDVGGTRPGLSFGTGIKLAVKKEDESKAKKILAQIKSGEEDKELGKEKLKAQTKQSYMLPILSLIFFSLAVLFIFPVFNPNQNDSGVEANIVIAILFAVLGLGPLYSWKVAKEAKKKLKKM